MILWVDPDTSLREGAAEAFHDAVFDTVGVDSLAAAREHLDGEDHVDCLVTEQRLPDGTGLELLQYARETNPDTVCVLFTDVPLEEIDTEAFWSLVAEYLHKEEPEELSELLDIIEHSLAFRSQTA